MIAIAVWKITAGLFCGLLVTVTLNIALDVWLFRLRRRRFLAETDRLRNLENARGIASNSRPGWLP